MPTVTLQAAAQVGAAALSLGTSPIAEHGPLRAWDARTDRCDLQGLFYPLTGQKGNADSDIAGCWGGGGGEVAYGGGRRTTEKQGS